MKRDPATDEASVWVFARDFLHAYMPKTRCLLYTSDAADE